MYGDIDGMMRIACSGGVFFFFQAEDGIRDLTVTGVQTCALPICDGRRAQTMQLLPRFGAQTGDAAVVERHRDLLRFRSLREMRLIPLTADVSFEIGRASCRERV